MRNRFAGNGLWVIFGMMLTLALGSAAWACDSTGCEGHGEVARSRDGGAKVARKRGGAIGELVVYGYPIVDEPEPVEPEPEDDLEPWDEDYRNPFEDDNDLLDDVEEVTTRGSCKCPHWWSHDDCSCGGWTCQHVLCRFNVPTHPRCHANFADHRICGECLVFCALITYNLDFGEGQRQIAHRQYCFGGFIVDPDD